MGHYLIGYTTGVFDMFHQGHLNILRNAKALCDRLVVGVSTDELCLSYKKKLPIMPFEERVAIMRAIKYCDAVVPQTSMDKYAAWEKYQFDVFFHGDDKGSTKAWKGIDRLKKAGVKIVFLPYTIGVSSTDRRAERRGGKQPGVRDDGPAKA
jgi:glycerol-3-phosphate cytidylyltransferase